MILLESPLGTDQMHPSELDAPAAALGPKSKIAFCTDIPAPLSSTTERFSIRVAARRSGLTTHVIRAWERRYRAIVPGRTDTDRRSYSDWEVHRLILLRQAVQHGHRIGEVAGLSMEALYALVARDTLPGLEAFPRIPYSTTKLIEMAVAAAAELAAPSFTQAILQASRTCKVPSLFDDFLIPLLSRISEMRTGAHLRLVSERFAIAQTRSALGHFLRDHALEPATCLMYAVAYRPMDELAALMAAVTAKQAGWDSGYLGTVPPEEIAYAVSLRRPKAVVVCMACVADARDAQLYFTALRQQLSPTVTIFVSGNPGAESNKVLADLGVSAPEDFRKFYESLEGLSCAPAPRSPTR